MPPEPNGLAYPCHVVLDAAVCISGDQTPWRQATGKAIPLILDVANDVNDEQMARLVVSAVVEQAVKKILWGRGQTAKFK